MAYAAVTCLRTTIHRLQNSSRISVASSTRTNLESADEEFGFLQQLLEESGGSSSSRFKGLDGEITGAVRELEDSLELHELNHFLLPQSESYGDEEELVRAITSSVEKVKSIQQAYTKELAEPSEAEEEEEEEEEERGDECFNIPSNMVGLTHQFLKIKEHLVENDNYVFWIIGMTGIGKTTLAERIYHDPTILDSFETRAFITIGQDYEVEEMERAIMDQVNPNKEEDDERLNEYLDDKRYLIVLDDVWNLGFWDDFFKDRCEDKANGSCILVTTRIEYLAMSLAGEAYFYMPFLNKEESWDLLRDRAVFREEVCPRVLENAGKQIAEKCDGLPLTLVTLAHLLSKNATTEEYWNEVAAHKQHSVFEQAYELMLVVLYPSYYHLPTQAKTCFLYMGAFPPKHQVRRSKLVNSWCAEGFLEPNNSDFASNCFDDLTFHHVVVPAPELSSDGQTYKACTLHSVFRHLCKKELNKNELLHIIDRYGEDGLIDGKRRLAIYNNVLLGVKGVYTSIDSTPTARSLLCTGPYHEYQVPIDFNLRLLRVCDALTIRFYEFPFEVLELVQLRYFAMTCDKNFPPSISVLWKLEYLIVHRHLNIKSTLPESYLPVEIWDLQELKHLQISGRNLPNPPCGVDLPNLVALLDVGTYTCTKGVLTSTPNLEKLRIQIEMTPISGEPLSFMDHISHLNALKSLQCVVVNPVLTPEVVVVPPRLSVSSITKLTLSGLGYPWQFLNIFSKIPFLKVLKLRHYAFHGEKWEVEENGFLSLECLLIEDNDLVQWKVGEGSFPCLHYLTLRSCYRLQELPNISSLGQIELVDCHPAAVNWAKETDSYLNYSWDAAADSENYIYSENYISCIYYTTTS